MRARPRNNAEEVSADAAWQAWQARKGADTMTLKQARAMAGATTWASHSREQVDTALATVAQALDKAEADLAALKARWDTLRASSKGLWEGRTMMALERGGCENCAHRHGADDKRAEWSCGEISEDGEGVRYFNVRFTCGAWAAKETS